MKESQTGWRQEDVGDTGEDVMIRHRRDETQRLNTDRGNQTQVRQREAGGNIQHVITTAKQELGHK